jgi:hypothetical protein
MGARHQLYIRAIELSPGYATGHQWYGEYLYAVGRTREAVVELERARELDPQSMIITTVLGLGYYYDRRYEDAIATARAATEMTEEVVNPYGTLLLALQASRRFPEAIETLSTMARMLAGAEAGERLSAELARAWREQGERGYWEGAARIYQTLVSGQEQGPTVPLAVAYLHAGDRERAFDWLERSIEQRSAGSTPAIFFDPGLDPIRDEPRFVRLLERMGLPPSSPR